MSKRWLVVALFLTSCGGEPEICGNGIDDDKNDLTDCLDPVCVLTDSQCSVESDTDTDSDSDSDTDSDTDADSDSDSDSDTDSDTDADTDADPADCGESVSTSFRYTALSAEIPATNPSGLAWDDDSTAPDTAVCFYLDGEITGCSVEMSDTYSPAYNTYGDFTLTASTQVCMGIFELDGDSAVGVGGSVCADLADSQAFAGCGVLEVSEEASPGFGVDLFLLQIDEL